MTAPQQFGGVMAAPSPINAAGVRQARTGPMPTGGRWGWYRDHLGNEYRRVSKLVKKVETDTYNLDLWYKRQVAEGLAVRDDLVLSIKAMGRPDPVLGWSKDDKKKIDGIVREAEQAAKQRNGARVGTAVHDLTERVDRGEPIDEVVRGLPAGPAHSLRAYAFLRANNGYRSVEIERTVVNDEVEAAGTFDRVDEVAGLTALLGPWRCQHGHDHDGESQVVVDVKTEAQPWLNGLHIGPQLGIYSRARKMWRPIEGTVKVRYSKTGDEVEVQNGEYVPAPCVRQDVGIVVHVHEGRATPLFINLIEGWEAAQAAYAQMNREARAKRELGSAGAWFAPVPGIVEPKPAQILSEHAAFADYARAGIRASEAAAAAAASPATPAGEYAVGDTVVVGGIEFTKHAEPGTGCPNCAPLLAGASATRTDGTGVNDTCSMCGRSYAEAMPVMVADKVAGDVGDTLNLGGVQTHEAVRGADGLVRWRAVADGAPPAPSTVPAAPPAPPGALDEVDKSAIDVVWAATDLPALAEVWRIYVEVCGRTWAGPVRQAAEARQRQIECPQRALHTGGGKCACGWMPPVPG